MSELTKMIVCIVVLHSFVSCLVNCVPTRIDESEENIQTNDYTLPETYLTSFGKQFEDFRLNNCDNLF